MRYVACLAAVIVLGLTGCTNYAAYVPRPAILMLRGNPPEPADQARVIVSVGGVQQPGKNPNLGANIRIENYGHAPVVFDPRQTTMLNAGLVPMVGPAGDMTPVTIAPGQAMLRTLEFSPVDKPNLDDPQLSMVTLRLTVQIDVKPMVYSLVFYRLDYPGYYYGYGPY